MVEQSATHPDFTGISLEPAARASRLQRFLGPAFTEDDSQAAYWRSQSDAAHAAAGAQFSDMAAQVAVQTGHGKNPDEMFPGLSSFQRARTGT
ncbi:MAG: hypothetical protein ACYCU0_06020 [Solirubrobacteraceae bacterium]